VEAKNGRDVPPFPIRLLALLLNYLRTKTIFLNAVLRLGVIHFDIEEETAKCWV
jgi:hypothetical protein